MKQPEPADICHTFELGIDNFNKFQTNVVNRLQYNGSIFGFNNYLLL